MSEGFSAGQKAGAEFLGTFFATLVPTSIDILYFSGQQVDFVSRWLARGFLTTALIYALSEISGAHIDPAVSLGFAFRGVLGARRLAGYWVAQFGGGFAAAGVAYAFWGSRIRLGATHPGTAYAPLTAFVVEIIATFLLMAVILLTAEQEASVGKQAAIAVGMTVAMCGFVAGPISGASMNPGTFDSAGTPRRLLEPHLDLCARAVFGSRSRRPRRISDRRSTRAAAREKPRAGIAYRLRLADFSGACSPHGVHSTLSDASKRNCAMQPHGQKRSTRLRRKDADSMDPTPSSICKVMAGY